MSKKNIERGQSITFRVPSDTPDYLLKQLTKLKETERRNFSSEIAGFVLKGVNETYAKDRETITVPLPKQLTKEQKSWLKHEHSEALIGTILYQLLNDPMRATTLLAALNSNTSNIDEALYLQEAAVSKESDYKPEVSEQDLDDVNIQGLEINHEAEEEPEEDEDPLGDFLSSMNK
ncbi:hypothetical protein CIL05_02350 [Virgibacillus profundi]|uniref:Uncharacterized protein n=1 Tax=Virgibacillus profundi TaxID=2024555 RepID=A0A2A2IJE7_9BACI|nr:hypothetical protein [Virgibacillus profundi]PAV31518.1 hypothetical protein CIL05_02350 [Virgibacillus profundi]PXY55704.1 hypothetical protein CIT14_02360 [Virgibacillus profundi]